MKDVRQRQALDHSQKKVLGGHQGSVDRPAKFADLVQRDNGHFYMLTTARDRRLHTRNTIDRACRPANNQFPEDEE
jgi:hypothetical protein